MMYGYGVGGGWIGMIVGGLIFIAFVIGLIFFVLFLVRAGRHSAWSGSHHGMMKDEPSAKDILQTRYAKGEITQAEYKKILDDLNK